MKIKISKIKKIFILSFVFFLTSLPLKIFAADPTQNFKTIADNITNNVISTIGTLFMAAAFMLFFYGVVIFMIGRFSGKGTLADMAKGKDFMIWGLISLFVMVSVWGIIKLVQGFLFDNSSQNIQITPITFDSSKLKTNTSNTTSTNLFSKNEGDSCTVLPGGTNSECKTGMYCKGLNNSTLSSGQTGTCQKSVNTTLGSKNEGDSCTVLPGGTNSECKTGLFCNGNGIGSTGVCKKPVNN